MSIHDRVPDGFRRSTTSKGWLKPTATTLRQQQTAAENRELRAKLEELTSRLDTLESKKLRKGKGDPQ